MNKREAKQNISKLVEKYRRIAKEGKIKSYNEAQTRNEFIEPLFGFLGWDMRNANNDNEVTTEETISNGRVDLAFRINGIPKFFLEAKSLKADLDIESYSRQAINYSWNKGVNWAVLTDFEGIKIFNANAKSKYLRDKLVFEIPCDEYISDFERLWLLSKESFEKNALDIYAEKHGKKSKKLTVNEKLFGDLKQAREILTKSFNNWKGHWDKNKDIDQETLDEGVQRILDRLVFIRVLEDRELEPPILQPIVREWEKDRSGNKQLFQMLTKKFRELNDIYNSNLFVKHACEDWEEYDDATKKAIELLYGNDVYEYDFKGIPADILGGVYESYLGYIAQKPIKAEAEKKSGKLSKTENKKDLKIKSRQKRKEQGIYYTPNFIVDYIVKSALGEKLEEIENVSDLKQIKILDPACGSGSFLIKALDAVNEKYKDFGNPGNQYTKSEILLSNIYGVDLDPQAVELAKLNLLINALDQKAKLPNLTDNIRVGNSLISGTEKELKKYFGKNWRDKKPFNWEEEFPFSPEKGFDVIIGNPPWGAEISNSEKTYYKNLFKSGSGIIDTFALFIEKSLLLLKDGSYLGFILPDIILLKNYPQIRELILESCIITDIYYTGMAFKGVNLDSVVIILKKEKEYKKRNNNRIDIKVDDTIRKIEQKLFLENKDYKFNLNFDSQTLKLKRKLESKSIKLGSLLEIHEGIHSGNIREKLFIDENISKDCKKLLFRGAEINRYYKKWNGKYVNYNKNIINRNVKEYANLGRIEYFTNPKILVRRTGDKLLAMIDEDKYFASNNFFVLYEKDKLKEKLSLKYLLAILNSSLSTWYFLTIQPRKGKLFAEIKINHLAEIPIYKIDFSDKKEKAKHDKLVKLTDKILKLNKQLQSTPENSDKWNGIKKEIGKVDGEIDERVFELYGLGEEEIGIIENIQ